MASTPTAEKLLPDMTTAEEPVLVDEYGGAVNDPASARSACQKMGDAELAPVLPDSYVEMMKRSTGDNFIGFWEAMVRAELRRDPDLLSG